MNEYIANNIIIFALGILFGIVISDIIYFVIPFFKKKDRHKEDKSDD